MNWYKNIKIAASPKNIVNQWNVDDPFLKFFIYTYEPLIDLNKIKSKEDLNAYIKNELIPSLQSKIDIDNPKGYYKRTMTDEEALAEIDEHDMDPRVQQAIKVFKQDPKAAKKILLKATNDDKKLSFDRWWDYMASHTDSPAFFYSMLNPIIESSPAGQKNGAPPVNIKAVESIKNEIGNKGVTQMNIFKKYVKTSFKLDQEASADDIINIDDDKQWIRVDSKLKDPKKYKENQDRLMRYATDSGWCIARNHYSDQYLSQGDFWLYFENKRPKVAIRLVGNSSKGDNKVAEIRGLHNQTENLEPYWEQVTTFLHNTDFDYTGNEHYKHLRGIMEKNVNLKELEQTDPAKFQQIYQSFLNAVKADPKQLGQMSAENRKNYPELTKTAAIGYERKLNSLLDAVEQIPPTGNEYQNRFAKFQDEFNDVPDDVRPYLSNDIEGRLVGVHKGAFMRNPLEYENFPDDMKAIITPEEKKVAWTNYVGQDPYRYNDSRIPTEMRKYIPVGPILQGWARLVDMNISHADNIPKALLNITNSKGQRFFPENYIENKIIADFKRYPCNKTSEGYDKLDRIKKRGLLTEEQIGQVYADFVSRNANNTKMQNPILYVPPQYRDLAKSSLTDLTPIVDRYYQRVINNASYFEPIDDPNIRNILLTDERYREGVILSFKRLRENKYRDDWNGFWTDIPEDVKASMPGDVKEAVAGFWVPYVQKNPALMNRLDNFIRPLVENKIQPPQSPQPIQPPQQPPNRPIGEASGNWFRKVLS